MAEPKIAQRRPAVIELAAGTYEWCVCGLSQTQPFCDDSHKGTGFHPLVFTLDAPRKVALCQCKHTGGQPFCDGTHKGLPAES